MNLCPLFSSVQRENSVKELRESDVSSPFHDNLSKELRTVFECATREFWVSVAENPLFSSVQRNNSIKSVAENPLFSSVQRKNLSRRVVENPLFSSVQRKNLSKRVAENPLFSSVQRKNFVKELWRIRCFECATQEFRPRVTEDTANQPHLPNPNYCSRKCCTVV